MKLECTECHARYSIDDAVVPARGAKIRCRKCGCVITVLPAGAPGAAAPPAVPAPTGMPVVPPTPEAAPVADPSAGTQRWLNTPSGRVTVSPAPRSSAPASVASGAAGFSLLGEGGPQSSPPSRAGAPPQAATGVPGAPPAPVGATGSAIPEGLSAEEKARHEKARRLARVLASDIAIYNREKKDRGLADGNLVAVLGYEIKKSWEIYKERVGADFANATPYFRDALNDLLAEGRKIF